MMTHPTAQLGNKMRTNSMQIEYIEFQQKKNRVVIAELAHNDYLRKKKSQFFSLIIDEPMEVNSYITVSYKIEG